MLNLPHPDELKDWQDFKAIKRGGKQVADTAAMEAMFDAIEAGLSRSEAERIFSQTYKKEVNGMDKLQGKVT
jgi:hypothetical protein